MRPSTTSRPRPLPDAAGAGPTAWRFEAIGTLWQIDTDAPLAPAVRQRVTERIAVYDRAWSRFREDSLVARIATAPGSYALPAEAGDLLEVYRALYAATDGAVSPLVGRSLEALGYDRAYSLRPGGPPLAAPRWEDAVAWDGATLTTVRPTLLDVGAAGKGQLVDLVLDELARAGVTAAIVDAGGDIRRRGSGRIRVGLEHPGDATRAIGVVGLGDEAICASAGNRRRWGAGLHHVLDATTGLPAARVLATWAIAPTALVADGLATALFFADGGTLDRRLGGALGEFAWVRVLAGGRLEASADLRDGSRGELFA
ncbi:FAD:protein FMN transferase [Galbitalea sp. SE-J8]|uniref:FAD:protein FMN transferase n=1 Tax=Galbitalea sp. SE-J8 TaxID=3054952 RepID=UPI00259CACC2|nr:FAD:protein FMN transferase [Galbitalea sp. SE-J8]MDM4761399.1 FAD:protein FMN transferase [Galbitalea sp. SE-J8]